MKRSDLDSLTLAKAVDKYRGGAWTVLCTRYLPKVILAAIERDVRAGYLNYGVSAASPWLEQAGADLIASERASLPRSFTDEQLAERDTAIEARVRAELAEALKAQAQAVRDGHPTNGASTDYANGFEDCAIVAGILAKRGELPRQLDGEQVARAIEALKSEASDGEEVYDHGFYDAVAAAARVARSFAAGSSRDTTPSRCCDMHNEHCEPPAELCCERCTEVAHDTFPIRHSDGSTCVHARDTTPKLATGGVTFRVGGHWGTTIVREGRAEPDEQGRRADDELAAVAVNGDRSLASRIVAGLNAPAVLEARAAEIDAEASTPADRGMAAAYRMAARIVRGEVR